MSTTIEWTDETWNPVRGCVKVSPGCKNCYAETFAERWRGVPGHPYEQGFDLRLVPHKLAEPLSWKKPRRVFVNSMSDLFQDGVPDEYIGKVFDVMALAWRHTFQVLTKRPERMRALVPTFASRHTAQDGSGWPLKNVWLGVSVENQHFADERIPVLLQTPAAVRFISAEPLLGPIDLGAYITGQSDRAEGYPRSFEWVIAGGESGSGAREHQLKWSRHLQGQCLNAGVAFFFKQAGTNVTANFYDTYARNAVEARGAEWPDPIGWHEHDGQPMLIDRVRLHFHKKGGALDELPEDLRVREFPTVSV